MAYMRRIGTWTTAHPGNRTEPERTMSGDLPDVSLRTGDTFPGGRRHNTPNAPVQRHAMALADATGVRVAMVDGHLAPAMNNGNARTWDVKRNGAPGESHRPGWLITVTAYAPGLGWRPEVTHVRTFPEVVAFLAFHFGPRVSAPLAALRAYNARHDAIEAIES